MSKNSSKKGNTVIMSDKYISESGVQGGNAIAEHITLVSFLFGIPFFIIGLIALISILFGFQTNPAVIYGIFLITVIGLLLIVGGYFNYRDKQNS